MKRLPILTLLGTIACIGNANATHIYANNVSAHNTAVLQHTIAQTAFASFAGPMSIDTGTKATLPAMPTEDPKTTYGHAPMYGEMSLYGEFNDDGRSGGDYANARKTLNNGWFNWQHLGNDTKFNELSRLDSSFDLYIGGITSGETYFKYGRTAWGIYTGYIDGNLTNQDIDTNAQGGFFGIYNKYATQNFNISSTINGGVVDNITDTTFGTDEHTTFWIAGTANIAYNIAMDNTFTLQPSIQAGYTWIKSENYTSASGDIITNDAFNMFEITPTFRAIKHIGNNWYGALDVRHVMIFANNGDITVNDTAVDTLNYDNFTEYGISLEKSVGHITLRANIGRREGSHNGWTGGLNFKYLF